MKLTLIENTEVIRKNRSAKKYIHLLDERSKRIQYIVPRKGHMYYSIPSIHTIMNGRLYYHPICQAGLDKIMAEINILDKAN